MGGGSGGLLDIPRLRWEEILSYHGLRTSNSLSQSSESILHRLTTSLVKSCIFSELPLKKYILGKSQKELS